jgi:hypothetical protein
MPCQLSYKKGINITMNLAYDRLQELEDVMKMIERVKPAKPSELGPKHPTIFQWADYFRRLKAWQKRHEDIADRLRQVRSLLDD